MTPRPTPGQLAWQRAGFGLFFHFGINTFNDVEWSDGTLHPDTFQPSDYDIHQWVETAASAGARYAVLTAKHHDGFCLWPTATTAYSVASSSWRNGRGDVVRDFTEACRAAGLGAGLYLSPWDRNAACYSDPAAYDDFYANQLTELFTRYGDLFELWFDGAGSEGRSYDWDRFMDIVKRHQPEAMVFNLGRPTIRWIGNEDGLASDPCTYATRATTRSIYASGDDALTEEVYLPPECDVPIRANWFWQPDDLATLKSRVHLLAIWYRSVGMGAGLLLNVPPDRRGQLDPADCERLMATSNELQRRFGTPLPATLRSCPGGTRLTWEREVTIDHLDLAEDLVDGQLIGRHEVLLGDRVVASGESVGVRRVHTFPAVTTRELVVRHDRGRLERADGHRTGHEAPPTLEPEPSGQSAG